MTKFKITRYITRKDEVLFEDRLEVKIGEGDDNLFDVSDFEIDTQDLPDLIKALQDKEKEIHGN